MLATLATIEPTYRVIDGSYHNLRGRGNFWRLSDDADLRDGRGRGKNRNYVDASGFRDYEEYR